MAFSLTDTMALLQDLKCNDFKEFLFHKLQGDVLKTITMAAKHLEALKTIYTSGLTTVFIFISRNMTSWAEI